MVDTRKSARHACCATAFALMWAPGLAQAQAVPSLLLKGDIIHTDVDLDFKQKAKVTDSDAEAKDVCLPKGTGFDIVHADGTKIYMNRRNRWTIKRDQSKSCTGDNLGLPGEDRRIYGIDTQTLHSDYYRHFGITHGALFVPFKRRSDKSLSGESNLGYFLGYRFEGPFGLAITPAGSAGVSIVNVTDDSTTTGTSTLRDTGTRAAFTWAAGFILTHVNAFQVGAFIGADRIGGEPGKVWKYEGKRWVSVAFGYAFTK
jgi:hypothetical protein